MSRQAIRVALVDDDASVRKALGRVLSACSFEIETYGSAREFMASGTIKPPNCLVLDLHMPELSGLDLQHQLRSAGIDIPTIIVTAYNEPGFRERCQAAGASAFLLKPLNCETLISAINVAIKRG